MATARDRVTMKHGCTIATESVGDQHEVRIHGIPGLDGTLWIRASNDMTQGAIAYHLRCARTIKVIPAPEKSEIETLHQRINRIRDACHNRIDALLMEVVELRERTKKLEQQIPALQIAVVRLRDRVEQLELRVPEQAMSNVENPPMPKCARHELKPCNHCSAEVHPKSVINGICPVCDHEHGEPGPEPEPVMREDNA